MAYYVRFFHNNMRIACRIIIVIFFLLVALALHRYFVKSWTTYYAQKLYKEPRPLLIQALEYFKTDLQEKKALDLGAGVGNDTAYLLAQGWHVWANDAESEALVLMKMRADIQLYAYNAILMHKSFSDLPWAVLPQFDLVYAGYSLPFVPHLEFMLLWQNVVQAIKPGGIFAAHFFDYDHGAFNQWTRRNMTFFTKEALLELFHAFKIESFKEIHEKNAQGVLEHSYEVIARKI